MMKTEKKNLRIKGVLFDFDGTLTLPGALNFSVIREEMGCPEGVSVLDFIDNLTDTEQREVAKAILEKHEFEAAETSIPNPVAEDLVYFLKAKRIPVGIITRNSLHSLERAMNNFKSIRLSGFDLVITRDTAVKPKPNADGIFMAAEKWQIPPHEIAVVGDYIYDIDAGKNAGAVTILLDNGLIANSSVIRCDRIISDLNELMPILRMSIPLRGGKLPNELLKELLDRFYFHDPSVIVNPGIGEDTAAVDIAGEELIVLKSDPITFATDSIGYYAVLINANDIATSGATPRWLLTTLLFPVGTTANEIHRIVEDLNHVCRNWKITLCGGHTEITDAVNRPIISGMLVGTVSKRRLIDKRTMGQGDDILITKGVAVEGTSIIAREFGDQLKALGMTDEAIHESCEFLSSISIIEEARIACAFDGIHALHDVTEGGIVTAIRELSIAGGHKINIDMDRIPVFPQTRNICKLLGIDPLGLIGSGSLLICCHPDTTYGLIHRLRTASIQVSRIGKVLEPGEGIQAVRNGDSVAFPQFDVDEITRLF